MRQRLAVGCLSLAVLGAIGVHAPAGAQYDGIFPTALAPSPCLEGPHYCRADDAAHDVYIGSSVANYVETEIHDTLDNSYEFTDLDIIKRTSSTVSYTGDFETDVIYIHVHDLPLAVRGQAICDDRSTTLECDQFYVRLNAQFMWDWRNDEAVMQKVACHETGHTTGLVHGEFTTEPTRENDEAVLECMKTGTVNVSRAKALGSMNAAQINGLY